MASPPRSSRWSVEVWRWPRCRVRLVGRGEQGGFLDLVDRSLLVAVLDPACAAAGADGDRVQTEGDGDQGRSAQRAAWHVNLTDGRRALVVVGVEGCMESGVKRGASPAATPLSAQLGVASSLLAAEISVRLGRTWMRLGLASSALGTRIWSTPSSNEASICSAITWAGRVIDRRKAP